MSLRPNEKTYWENYISTLPESEALPNTKVTAGYAGNPEITDELLLLYLEGKKTAGSSLAEDFQTAGDPLPQVGDYWIYLNSSGKPCCILRTDRVVTHKFKDIPLEIAIAEGEGDLSLAYWKRTHAELYNPFLQQWGISDLNEATVVTEFFKIVYRG
jgi:uncharacterized protein YhfF